MSVYDRLFDARDELLKSEENDATSKIDVLSQVMSIAFRHKDNIPERFMLNNTLALDAPKIKALLESVLEFELDYSREVCRKNHNEHIHRGLGCFFANLLWHIDKNFRQPRLLCLSLQHQYYLT